ncbi:MAG: immunoglobulin-like domain-containing protein [Coprobacillaceae bacterium]
MKNKIIGTILLFFTTISTLLVILALNVVPLQLKLETFKYEYGTDTISTNVADYINANSSVIELAQLNLSEVKNEVGVYPASITYMDEVYPFYIKIVDTTKPVVQLKQVQQNIAVDTTLDAIDLLDSIEDSSDVVAYFENEDETLVTTKTFSKKGSYIENIIVKDSSDNQSAKLRVKIVVGDNGDMPSILGIEDVEIKVGKHFDPMLDVTATDGKGKDITSKIQIIKNSVNTKEEGIYEVIYTVTNDTGNTIQRSRKVLVID